MLNLSEKNYITIWKVEIKQNYVSAFGTSGKKQKDGTYKNSKWNIKFLGNAKEPAKSLSKLDRIVVTSAGIENVESQDGSRDWLTLLVFNFEMNGGGGKTAAAADTEVGDDDLPF